MFVKKFQAPTLEQALSQVKMEFGPDALILATEEKKGGMFRSIVEITAGVERKKRTVEDGVDEEELQRIFPHRKLETSDPSVQGKSIRKVAINRYVDIEDPAPTPMRSHLIEQYFLKLGISEESATQLTRRLRFEYAKEDLAVPALLEKAKAKLISEGLQTVGDDIFQFQPSWVAMGLSGSGKTSFIVKLALHLKTAKRVPLVKSIDKRKLVGRGELAAYARAIGIPFQKENEGLKRLPLGSVELIDTPSLPLNNDEANDVEKICRGRSVVLVIDATQRLKEILRVLETASAFVPKAIAFSKLDLVSDLGTVYDVLRLSKLPLLGVSVSSSFKSPIRFFSVPELSQTILRLRGIQ